MDTTHLKNILDIVDLQEVDTRAARTELARILQAFEEARVLFEIRGDMWSQMWLNKYREGGNHDPI